MSHVTHAARHASPLTATTHPAPCPAASHPGPYRRHRRRHRHRAAAQLSACPPFSARDDTEMHRQICDTNGPPFPPKYWATIRCGRDSTRHTHATRTCAHARSHACTHTRAHTRAPSAHACARVRAFAMRVRALRGRPPPLGSPLRPSRGLTSPSLRWPSPCLLLLPFPFLHFISLSFPNTHTHTRTRTHTRTHTRARHIARTRALSPSAIDLIRGLLVVDPSRRLTAFESLQHPWVVSIQAHASDLLAEAPDAQHAPLGGPPGPQPLFRDRIGEFNLQRYGGRGRGEGRGRAH
jgi:serine/threonine protein kinase